MTQGTAINTFDERAPCSNSKGKAAISHLERQLCTTWRRGNRNNDLLKKEGPTGKKEGPTGKAGTAKARQSG